MFLRVQGEKFFGAFLSFFVFEDPYHQFHITKKSATRRTHVDINVIQNTTNFRVKIKGKKVMAIQNIDRNSTKS